MSASAGPGDAKPVGRALRRRTVSRTFSPLEAVQTARAEWLGGNEEGASSLIEQLAERVAGFPPLRLLLAERALASRSFKETADLLDERGEEIFSGPAARALAAELRTHLTWLEQGSGPFNQALAHAPGKVVSQLKARVAAEGPYGVGLVLLEHVLLRHQSDLKPAERASAFAALGLGHYRARRLGAAIAAFEAQIACQPKRAEAHFNLGTALSENGDRAGAEAAYGQALARNPDLASAHHNLGNLLWAAGRIDEAGHHFQRTVELSPDHAEAALNLGFFHLLNGDYEKGWPCFERRFQTKRLNASADLRTDWDGTAVPCLVLEAEQGLGDSLQFARFLDRALARAERVYLRVQAPLVPLFERQNDRRLVVEDREKPTDAPGGAARAGLMSLARVLGIVPEQFADALPLDLPSLPPTTDTDWSALLGRGLNVGLVWAGNPDHMGDAQRSIDFGCLAGLLGVEGVVFHSLQVGEQALGRHVPGLQDLGPYLKDFRHTVGALKALDMVISVDTAVAHLAGSMGCPTWLLIPTVPDWRWGREGYMTPWYPSLRLFRQTVPGDWDGVIKRVRRALGQEKR